MDQASILYRQFPGIAATNTQGKQWEDAGCFGVSGAQGRLPIPLSGTQPD